jgi:hypothetical protein
LTHLEDRLTPSGAVLGDFGTSGLYRWTSSGGWMRLTTANLETADIASSGDTVGGDFGASGVWRYTSSSWSKLSNLNADQVVVADDGTIAADFGNSGLWRWTSGGVSFDQPPANAEQIDISADGSDATVFADFGAVGLWRWKEETGSRKKLTAINPQRMAASPDDGAVVADLVASGFWGWGSNDVALLLDHANPTAVTCMEDGAPVGVYASGVWKYTESQVATKLTANPP